MVICELGLQINTPLYSSAFAALIVKLLVISALISAFAVIEP